MRGAGGGHQRQLRIRGCSGGESCEAGGEGWGQHKSRCTKTTLTGLQRLPRSTGGLSVATWYHLVCWPGRCRSHQAGPAAGARPAMNHPGRDSTARSWPGTHVMATAEDDLRQALHTACGRRTVRLRTQGLLHRMFFLGTCPPRIAHNSNHRPQDAWLRAATGKRVAGPC